MLGAVQRRLRGYVLLKEDRIPGGYSWPFVLTIDVTLAVVLVVAGLQRPMGEWWIGAVALALASLPWIVFVGFNLMVLEALSLWVAWTGAIALLLFVTSTPIEGDFAPVLLSLLTGVVGSVTTLRGGLLAAGGSAALLLGAAALDRVHTPALYLSMIGIGWLIGYLMRIQQQLLVQQRQAQEKLAEHAAADERRRIAREVHDVIAHSLSVTLLHVTGARRELQQDRDVDEAVSALEDAERLGRQAMADIRRTVGLLDGGGTKTAPEPGVGDLAELVDDFVRAGLSVALQTSGRQDRISPTAGLALYRIAQESLANIAKHAPSADSEMTLAVTASVAALTVTSRVPVPVGAPGAEGRGMRGMRQRVELLGGAIQAGTGRRRVGRARRDTPRRGVAGLFTMGPRRVTDAPVAALLVDDQELVRSGLRRILRRRDGIEVVGECADGDEVPAAVAAQHPDVVVMDLRMKRVNGIEATRRLAAEGGPPVLALTTFSDEELLSGVLRAGAAGFVLKDSPAEELIRAVHAVARGDGFLDPAITGRVLSTYRAAPCEPAPAALVDLTPRELDVLKLIAAGRSNTEIADELVISGVTVKSHIGRIFLKLGLRDRAAAIVFAYQHGITAPR